MINEQIIYSTCFSKCSTLMIWVFYVCIQLAVRQVQSDWQALDPIPPRVGLRSAWTTSGVLCVMTSGMLMMLTWPADSWDSPDTVSINAHILWFPSWYHQCWNPTKTQHCVLCLTRQICDPHQLRFQLLSNQMVFWKFGGWWCFATATYIGSSITQVFWSKSQLDQTGLGCLLRRKCHVKCLVFRWILTKYGAFWLLPYL